MTLLPALPIPSVPSGTGSCVSGPRHLRPPSPSRLPAPPSVMRPQPGPVLSSAGLSSLVSVVPVLAQLHPPRRPAPSAIRGLAAAAPPRQDVVTVCWDNRCVMPDRAGGGVGLPRGCPFTRVPPSRPPVCLRPRPRSLPGSGPRCGCPCLCPPAMALGVGCVLTRATVLPTRLGSFLLLGCSSFP